jgi:hypothetical protein
LICHAESVNSIIKNVPLDQLPQHDVFSVQISLINEGQVPIYTVEGSGLFYDEAVPQEISRRLKLSFYAEGDVTTEMCFLNSPEVRLEFKVSFTRLDVGDYINAVLHGPDYVGNLQDLKKAVFIPFPVDTDVFWRMVGAGQGLRHKAVR